MGLAWYAMPCRGSVYVRDGSTDAGVVALACGSGMWSRLPGDLTQWACVRRLLLCDSCQESK